MYEIARLCYVYKRARFATLTILFRAGHRRESDYRKPAKGIKKQNRRNHHVSAMVPN